jgi:hypothetical protein
MAVILLLGKWRQVDHKFKTSLGYIASLKPAWGAT